jgi:hypothetical protein
MRANSASEGFRTLLELLQAAMPAGRPRTPAPTIDLIRLKTSAGIVASPSGKKSSLSGEGVVGTGTVAASLGGLGEESSAAIAAGSLGGNTSSEEGTSEYPPPLSCTRDLDDLNE